MTRSGHAFGWKTARLGDLGEISGGSTPSTRVLEYWDGDIPWLVPGEVTRHRGLFITETERMITKAGLENSGTRLLPPGTVLMTSRATIGEVVINTVPMATNQGFINIVGDESIVFNEFLAFWLQNNKDVLVARSHGVTFKEITKPNFKLVPILLPPLPEQHAIARILRAVQAAREAQQREVSLERERKAALMSHLFTHGTRGEPTKQTPIGEMPVSWEVVRLAKCAYIQTGTAKGRRFKDSEPTIDVPYLRVANVQDGYLDLSEIKNIEIRASEYDRYRLQAGDVLMTEGGDADKLGRGFIWHEEVPGCVHQNHVFAVRVNRDLLTPEFLTYQTQSPYGKAYFLNVGHRTTNLASINSTKLGAYPALLAPLDEQERIVGILHACDAKIAALERESALLDELFRALLEELMTGRVAVAWVVES